MEFKETVLQKVQQAKDDAITLDVKDEEGNLVSTMTILGDTPEEVKMVANWREQARDWYPSVFPYNLENTKKWIENAVMQNPERIVFLLRDPEGIAWGHIGIATFDWEKPSCEIDAVMRGRNDVARGGMTPAVQQMVAWAKEYLQIPNIALRVFADNERGIRLYERVGFERTHQIPLFFEEGEPVSIWRECKEGEKPGRHFQVMELKEECTEE